MKKIVIVTDSSSGITQAEAKTNGIVVVPIPFTIDGKEYLEDKTITAPKFFEMIAKTDNVSTSQTSRFTLEETWNKLLEEYEHIIYIPITSGLSGACHNAIQYAKQYDGRVSVIDNLRISVALKVCVYEAAKMAEQGKSVEEIVNYLYETKDKFSIYLTLTTLKYLRKGGRITPAAAMIGDMLRLKPILYTRGQNFDKTAMVLTLAQAKKKMMAEIKKELQTEFKTEYEQGKMILFVAHTALSDNELQKFKTEISNEFPNMKILYVDPLCLAVGCHTGPGALGFGIAICNYL
ncbi:MAG: DegV family protein [Clostridia bacterium]|nr:DegV family protein [Clostridia bacterium]